MNHKWTQAQVNELLRLNREGVSNKEIAEKFGVTEAAVEGQRYYQLRKGKAKKQLTKQSKLRKKVNLLRKNGEAIDLSTIQVKKVDEGGWSINQRNTAYNLWKKGAKYTEIAQLFGVTKGAVAGQIHQAKYGKKTPKYLPTRKVGRPTKDKKLAALQAIQDRGAKAKAIAPEDPAFTAMYNKAPYLESAKNLVDVTIHMPSEVYMQMLADCETLGITTSEFILRKIAFASKVMKTASAPSAGVVPEIINQLSGVIPDIMQQVKKAVDLNGVSS